MHRVAFPSDRIVRVLTSLMVAVILSSSPVIAQENNGWWRSLFQGTQKSVCDTIRATPEAEGVNEAPGVLLWEAEPIATNLPVNDRNENPVTERPVGTITQTCDERILSLDSAWHEEEHVLRGFRIQVHAGSLKSAREIRAQLRSLQQDWPVYLASMPPNYRVTLGDFRTRWEAEKVKDEWVESFPMSIVIPMDINLPVLR